MLGSQEAEPSRFHVLRQRGLRVVESERGGAGVGGERLLLRGPGAWLSERPNRACVVSTCAPARRGLKGPSLSRLRTESRAGRAAPQPSPGAPRSWNPSSLLFGRSGVHGRGHAGDQPPSRRVLQQPGLGEGLTWERRGDRGFLREVEDFRSAKGELRGILRGTAGGVSRGWTCIPRKTGN